jgi:hypothetical protein
MPHQIKEAYMLPVLEFCGHVEDRLGIVRLHGLLFISSGGEFQKGCFTRIGSFFINLLGAYEEFFKMICDEFPKEFAEELADESVYAETKKGEQDCISQYVITLS